MKIIQINRLEIENFKGIRSLRLDFNGNSASLYGDNATGKSSVYDAFTWLLFGKDSHGDSKFNVKPLDDNGKTDRAVMPTVTAELLIDGTPITFRKQLREKWEKHRGCTEEYAGNTVDYSIDDVPLKENQFKARVAELVSEDVFRVLTSVSQFCTDIPWKDRRRMLFEIACVQADEQILKEPQFHVLEEKRGGRTVEEYRAMLDKQKKDANGALNQLPARIDELERQLTGLPERYDERKRTAIIQRMDQLRSELAAIDHAEEKQRKQNEIRTAELEIRELEALNEQHRRSQDVPVIDHRAEMRQDVSRLKRRRDELQRDFDKLTTAVEMAEVRLADYRKRWSAINKQKYTKGVCRTCGQALPPEMEESARKAFETQKRESLDNLVKDSNLIKEQIAEHRKRMDEITQENETCRKDLTIKEDMLAHAPEPEKIIIEDLPEFTAEHSKLCAVVEQLKAELRALENDAAGRRDCVQKELAETSLQLQQENAAASRVEMRKSLVARIAELEDERHTRAEFVEECFAMIELCEDFVRYKVERVSTEVNSRFELVTFRLFREAINGGLLDCCDAVVNGVPYSDLNNAMQINAGMDCIRTLSEFYGVQVPLFVDNAESVTKLNTTDAQIIRLVVSEDDKELRLEV